MIVHPVNGSSSSSSSTRLLLRCAGACDGRTVNVTFSNGENFQVNMTACTVSSRSALFYLIRLSFISLLVAALWLLSQRRNRGPSVGIQQNFC